MATAPPQQPEKKLVAVDVHEFVRTRDALGTAYMSLSGAIDRAVKAYIDHTNVVLAGDGSLNISYLTQPFNQITDSAQIAQLALNGANQMLLTNGEEGKKGKRKKRAYKARDPNAPKRPLTAYFRYLQENRSKIGLEMQEKAGGVTQRPGDLSKEATERWNKLADAEQQPYRDAYQHALKDYAREVAKHKAAGGELSVAEANVLERAAKNEDLEVVAAAEQEDDDMDVDAKPADDDDDESSSSDEDDDEEEEEEKEPTPPPPPPPKVSSPETTKKTPESALKKLKQSAPPTPQFSSINPDKIPSASVSSTSPERKRKTPATPAELPDAEPSKKKRGRKTNAEKAAEAEVAAATPVAPKVEVPDTEVTKKKKRRVKAGADA